MARTTSRAGDDSRPPATISKKIKEFTPPTLEKDTASAPDAPTDDLSPRSRTIRQTQPQPTIRLASVSVMSEADQRRLELLLDALIEDRVARHLQKGES